MDTHTSQTMSQEDNKQNSTKQPKTFNWYMDEEETLDIGRIARETREDREKYLREKQLEKD